MNIKHYVSENNFAYLSFEVNLRYLLREIFEDSEYQNATKNTTKNYDIL